MSDAESKLKSRISQMRPALDACLDPVGVVNAQNQIVYSNLPMRSLLGLSGKDLKSQPKFSDRFKIAGFESKGGQKCPVAAALSQEELIRLDEAPAVRQGSKGAEKLRVVLKVVPFEVEGVTAAVVVLRDTTAEVLLQAKYHKILQVLQDNG